MKRNNMQDYVEMTGIVLKAEPYQEYDKRVVILTKEAGKITAFAKGARRSTSRLLAKADQFCFGTFRLLPGKNAYTLLDAQILNYFDELRKDFEAACYGSFFLEYADYYSVENLEAGDLLKLIYVAMRALSNDKLPNKLVQSVFEIRAMVINGEFPGAPTDASEGLQYAVHYIVNAPFEKLYTFVLTDEVLNELCEMTEHYRRKYIGRTFRSLDILKTL